jgi:predicted phage terminase large subunit-like protein
MRRDNEAKQWQQIRQKVLRRTDRSYYEFVKFVFSEVYPGVNYIDNWHVKVIANHLQAVYNTVKGRYNPGIIPTEHVKEYMKTDEVVLPVEGGYIFNPEYKDFTTLIDEIDIYDRDEQEHLKRLWSKYTRMRRLLIMIPPRYMKTALTTVMFPAWAWTVDPSLRFLTGSHNLEIALDFTKESKGLIESNFYRLYWGDRVKLKPDANTIKNFKTTMGGHRQTFGMTGGVTGLGGNFVLIDDPINIHDADVVADGKAVQDRVDTFRKSLITRLNNWDDVMVVIKQKACKDGISTYIQENQEELGFDILELPAEYIEGSPCVTKLGSVDPRKEEGELLWPERFPKPMNDMLKFTMGPAYWLQYQQQVPTGENKVIDTAWFKTYTKLPEMVAKIQAWDTAMKGSKGNDYWVCITFGIGVDGKVYILDVFRKQMNYPTGKLSIQQQYYKHTPQVIVVEDKSSGSGAIQELDKLPIISYLPLKDKVMRMSLETPLLSGGYVYIPLPSEVAWVSKFLDECDKFPFVRNDDQVDSLSMGLNFVKRNYLDMGHQGMVEVVETGDDSAAIEFDDSYEGRIMRKIKERREHERDKSTQSVQ